MKNSKEAKFFCESCGSDVPRKAKVCPVCGKFFASVRCPNCGRIGSTEEFKDGCPSCGYAMRPDGTYYFRKGFKGKEKSGKKSSFELFDIFGKKKNQGDSSLPAWIYIFCTLVLISLIIMLYSCL